MYLVVGEGTKRRVYLTRFAADDSPRFKAGPPGRTTALRFADRATAETAAARAQARDPYGYRWHSTIV